MRLLIFCFLLFVLLLSCQVKHIMAPDTTTQSPISFTGDKLPIPNSSEFIFRQIIKVNTPAENELYAWKIYTTNDQLPADIEVNADGWIMNNSGSIWSNKSSMQFDFASVDGKLSQIICKVQMRCQKNGIEQPIVEVPFRSNRILGTLIQAPFTNGAITGSGFTIKLRENITDIFVEGMYAHHFMYRVNRTNTDGEVLEYGLWFNSINGEDIRQVILGPTTSPSLTPNTEDEMTQFEVYVVTRQGIEEETHKTISFKVQGGFRPQTVIYSQSTMALGAYHYTTSYAYLGNYSNLLLGSLAGHLNRQFFKDETTYTVINSNDLQVCLTWGYHGQFGVQPDGPIPLDPVTDDPNDFVSNICMDSLDVNYFASIQYYDLRLNNAAFPSLPSFGSTQIVTHTNGTTWLRIHSIPGIQKAILTGLPAGSYSFEASAVDSQGSYDLTPAVFSFTISEYLPPASRTGILIVDDEVNNSAFCPDTAVDQYYNNVLPTQYGSIDQWDLASIQDYNHLNGKLPLHILIDKKLVVWHSDGGALTSSMDYELDALNIYLENGGKLIISGGQNLYPLMQSISLKYPSFIPTHFGNNDLLSNMHPLASSFLQKPWFISAISEATGYLDVPLNLATPFNPFITSRRGIGPVCYFDDPGSGTALYKFGCKEPGADNYSPSQDDYDMLIAKHVALRFEINNSSIAIFGFPLSYMEQANTQQMLNTLISSMIQSKRNK